MKGFWWSRVGEVFNHLCSLIFLVGASGCDAEAPQGNAPSSQATATAPALTQPAAIAPQLAGAVTVVQGEAVRDVSLQDLAKRSPLREVATLDPYYKKEKRFLAFSWPSLLPVLLGESEKVSPERLVQLTAKDGYQVRVTLKLLQDPHAYLAVGEAKTHRFEPIGPQNADPGPLYMIWEGVEYGDEKLYPRPWAIVRVELLEESASFQHLRPSNGFADNVAAERGHDLFEKACLRCHSINQEGGKVGPDLNVPQNILAYRPLEQVRAYIKNPGTFRYSTMPAHPHFTEADLDDLVSYLRLMGQHQHDPGKVPAKEAR